DPTSPLKLNIKFDVLPDLPRKFAVRSYSDFPSLSFLGLDTYGLTLRIDGEQVCDNPRFGFNVESGPDFDQAEQLRRAIVANTQLYFYRWRPHNETYLFGFRKHEQGKNAKEVAEFDPLIAKAEEEIDKLKKPKAHRYEIAPAETEKQKK